MKIINTILLDNENWFNKSTDESRVISWFSGGVASAVACQIALETYKNVHFAFCDTGIEHPDTYRFITDFENKFNVKINIYKSKEFSKPEDVFFKYNGLNFAHGAPCSMVLKKNVRTQQVEKLDTDYAQVFGFDFCKKEIRRASQMIKNHAEINPKFPLIEQEIDRSELFRIVESWGIAIPKPYDHFNNNNCIGTEEGSEGGCVQGGVGYWQKMKEIYPKKFARMAEIEHELSKKNGKPTTICKDQRKNSKGIIFLTKNIDFPEIGSIDDIKGKQPIGRMECNGFCSTQDQLGFKY